MRKPSRPFTSAPAILAVLFTCIGCGASGGKVDVGSTPTPAATVTMTPSLTAAPTAAPSGTSGILSEGEPVALAPGRYAFADRGTGPGIVVTVPAGWVGNWTLVAKDTGDPDREGPVVFGWPFDHGFKDPCTDHTPVIPAEGSGAAGLLRVIAGQAGIDAGRITDVTVGGHDGKFVDYTVTADPTTCGNGQDGFWIWGVCSTPATLGCEDAPGGDRRYGVSKGDAERVYAVDVDGHTYTFFTGEPRDLVAAERAELQQVIDSIEFEPA
jgi:hypothetical protein